MRSLLGRSSVKWLGASLSLAVIVAVVSFSVISFRMQSHNVEVRGCAADYDELAVTSIIKEYVAYFPRAARRIEYWCRPYWTGINGSFDITEPEFLDWARSMGWQPIELQPNMLVPDILIMHTDGTEEWVKRAEKCYVYIDKRLDNQGRICRDFEILYDRTNGRAYFTDVSDSRSGPPVQDQ